MMAPKSVYSSKTSQRNYVIKEYEMLRIEFEQNLATNLTNKSDQSRNVASDYLSLESQQLMGEVHCTSESTRKLLLNHLGSRRK